tara:strand:- start:3578 stop:5689 length:2112 start_codon:yes stop_codon:yes gene_type:complete
MNYFEDLGEDLPNKVNVKPFHVVKDKDDQELHKWCTKVIESLEKQAIVRNAKMRRHLETYRGISSTANRTDIRRSERQSLGRITKFIVNHLHDMTETRISQLTRLKASIDVLPTNDEFQDRSASKVVKYLINHLWYINNIDEIRQRMLRNAFIFGESYCFVEWNKDKGDLHPMWVKARDMGIKLPLIDDEGNIVTDEDGKEIILDPKRPVKTGDVEYKIEVPWRVYLQRQKKIEDVEYCFRVSVEATDTIKKEYPGIEDKIKSTTNVKSFDQETLTDHLLEEETVIYEFWHKKTKHCPDGYYIKFTTDVLLEKKSLPYSNEGLPFVRLTDQDIPENLNGTSTYEMVAPIQSMHDNLSTLLAKNIYMMGHAKWVMPRGACKIEALGNDNTIVQYQGPVPPQMVQTTPNPPEAYAYRNQLRDELGQIYGIQGVSRGQPPSGITAAVALQFLNEQEQERNHTMVIKHNTMVIELAKKTISLAGDYYQPDDGRMLRIVGKNNKYAIKHFDTSSLHKSYDVRLAQGSALPESKAGRIQRIVEIMQMKPDLLANERWIDLLDLGNTDKMNSLITVAVRAAESENEDLMAGRPVGDPEEFEDHIIHWKTHTKAIQDRTFKEECPPEYRQELLEHIAIHEFLMVEKAKVNPLFQAKLAELPLFPIFPNGFTPLSKEQQQIVVQGQANRGEQVTGMIPGEETQDIEQGEKNE